MQRHDNTKRYNQLAVGLLKKIFNGYYKLGSKLPSTRELAKQTGVNPNTMQRALQVLQDEKILIKQSTTGSFLGERYAADILRSLQKDAGECGYVDENGTGIDEPPEPERYPWLYRG